MRVNKGSTRGTAASKRGGPKEQRRHQVRGWKNSVGKEGDEEGLAVCEKEVEQGQGYGQKGVEGEEQVGPHMVQRLAKKGESEEQQGVTS